MKDYLKIYQAGGEMSAAPAEPTPQEGAGQDPMAQIVQGAMQAIQTNDTALAMQVCQMIAQIAGGGQQGAPAEPAPAFKKGGKMKVNMKKKDKSKNMPSYFGK